MLVRKNGTITALSDLRGKKIGYTEDSVLQILLMRILDKAQLTKNDVTLVPMNANAIMQGLDDGTIDAGMLWEPYVARMLNKGNYKVLQNGKGLYAEIGGYNATAPFIEENPEIVQGVLRALITFVHTEGEIKDSCRFTADKKPGLMKQSVPAFFVGAE